MKNKSIDTELNKAKYDLTTYQVKQIKALIAEVVGEIIGENEERYKIKNKLKWWTQIEEGRNQLRQEQRNRVKEILKGGEDEK